MVRFRGLVRSGFRVEGLDANPQPGRATSFRLETCGLKYMEQALRDTPDPKP